LKKDEYIIEIVVTGPKSYAYLTSLDNECTKVKGFSLHYKNLQKINRENMKKVLDNEISIITQDSNIIRDRETKKSIK